LQGAASPSQSTACLKAEKMLAFHFRTHEIIINVMKKV
jgi:hypothetical protein